MVKHESNRLPNRFTVMVDPAPWQATIFREFRNTPVQEIISGFPETLTEAINTLLADPFLQIDQSPDRGNTMVALVVATSLPTHASQLKEAYTILRQELEQDKEEPSSSIPRRLTALLVADILLSQTSLPIDKRTSIRFSHMRRVTTQAIRTLHTGLPADQETLLQRNSLIKAKQDFQAKLDSFFQPPLTQDQARLQVSIHNAISKFAKSSLAEVFRYYGSEQTRHWMINRQTQTATSLSRSLFSTQLLLEGAFDKKDPLSPVVVFANQWALAETNGTDDARKRALAEYFTTHPELQKIFWQFGADPRFISGEKASITRWFFEQDRETVGRFIDTMDISTVPIELQLAQMILLISLIAKLRQDSPDHPNMAYLIDRIRNLANKNHLLPYIERDFAILEDRVPGSIYSPRTSGARGSTPTPGQQLFKGGTVIYRSKASPPPPAVEPAKPASPVIERPAATLTISPGEENATAIISGWLDQQLARLGINRNQVAGLADHYQTEIARAAGGHLPFLIILEALPRNHPLRKLAEIGVITIQPNNGTVDLTVDPAKAHIQIDDKKVSLTKAIDDLKPQSSLLDLFLQTATLLAKRPMATVQLDRAERGEINGFLKDWNRRAADMNLPRLTIDAPKDQPSQPVMFLVGDKPTTLYVAS